MLEKFKDLFSKINFSSLKSHKENSKDQSPQGKFYGVWILFLMLASGLSLGGFSSVILGYGLNRLAGSAGVQDVAVGGDHEISTSQDNQKGLDNFLSANPFKISAKKADAPVETPKVEEKEPEIVDTELADLILRGTLPGIGAWIESKGQLNLLLIGKFVEGYKLTSVKYSEAVFNNNKKTLTKYISFGPVVAAKAPEPPKPAPAPAPAPAPVQDNSTIVAAAPGGQEGQVSSETVNQLVQNPFEELKRIRIRPNDTAGGLEVQWIQNDSILKRLGVQKGDVIRSVNGIPFTNMGDIANSINSLMNSERFDVEVTRNGKPEALRYVVR